MTAQSCDREPIEIAAMRRTFQDALDREREAHTLIEEGRALYVLALRAKLQEAVAEAVRCRLAWMSARGRAAAARDEVDELTLRLAESERGYAEAWHAWRGDMP